MANVQFWQPVPEAEIPGIIQCDLCPRHCRIRPGQRGKCYARMNRDGHMVLATYGRSTGFCIDPIEKKPLNHFLPGTPVLSFGSLGCNLNCACCQNWTIASSQDEGRLGDVITPEEIAYAAIRKGCRSIAMTYNEPLISFEYARDVSELCRSRQLQMVAVTNGYLSGTARSEFCALFDSFNVDLKGIHEDIYQHHCHGHLQPVLDTLLHIHHETKAWLEITTLVIPGLNDSDADIAATARWIADNLSPDVPLHLTAFHPDHKMRDTPATTVDALRRARTIAQQQGLKFVYLGNVVDPAGETTVCPSCQTPVIVRDRYALKTYDLDTSGNCTHCGTKLPGVFDGWPGTWGRKSQPVNMPVWRCMC
jgi:pyruvate formate lyase activating enzyme